MCTLHIMNKVSFSPPASPFLKYTEDIVPDVEISETLFFLKKNYRIVTSESWHYHIEEDLKSLSKFKPILSDSKKEREEGGGKERH